MKISQSKNYKKPLYALGLAAMMTVAATGCTDPVGYAGDEQVMTEECEDATEAKKEENDKSAEVSVIVDEITAGIVYIHTK